MKLGTHFNTITMLKVKIESACHIMCRIYSFLAIIRFIDEERWGVCGKKNENIQLN